MLPSALDERAPDIVLGRILAYSKLRVGIHAFIGFWLFVVGLVIVAICVGILFRDLDELRQLCDLGVESIQVVCVGCTVSECLPRPIQKFCTGCTIIPEKEMTQSHEAEDRAENRK